MSLAELIKNMHRSPQGTPSLGAKIEEYYIKKSHEFDEEKHKDRVTRFHASKFSYHGVCAREYYLLMKREELGLELERPDPFETSLLRIFDHGHGIHSMYQDRVLGPAGILYGKWKSPNADEPPVEGFQPSPDWTYIEPRMYWPEKRISGYCDGYLKIEGRWYLLEIKSSNDQSFRFLKRNRQPRDYHARQSQIYMMSPNDLELSFEVEGAFILYINKDTGEELDLFIPNDPSIVAPVLNQIDEAISCLDQSMIPPRLEACKTVKSKRAKDCRACKGCFAINHG